MREKYGANEVTTKQVPEWKKIAKRYFNFISLVIVCSHPLAPPHPPSPRIHTDTHTQASTHPYNSTSPLQSRCAARALLSPSHGIAERWAPHIVQDVVPVCLGLGSSLHLLSVPTSVRSAWQPFWELMMCGCAAIASCYSGCAIICSEGQHPVAGIALCAAVPPNQMVHWSRQWTEGACFCSHWSQRLLRRQTLGIWRHVFPSTPTAAVWRHFVSSCPRETLTPCSPLDAAHGGDCERRGGGGRGPWVDQLRAADLRAQPHRLGRLYRRPQCRQRHQGARGGTPG